MAKKQPIPENEIHDAAEKVRATPIAEVFAAAAAARPAAIRILAEGDSWFAYPKGGIFFGAPSNVVAHLRDMRGGPDLLIHDLSSNGDEAVAMICGQNKLDLLKRLSKQEYDLLLFSGGGNDVVGAYDFEFFLNEFQTGFGVFECIRVDRFERRLAQVRNAYCDLIELVGDYSRNKSIRVVTHTYDAAEPSPQGAEFFGGILKIDGAKSWMYPYLMTKKITDPDLQKGIVAYMLGRLRDMLKAIAMHPGYVGRFVVVDTHGLVKKNEWLNEIHPTSEGFLKVAKKIFDDAIKPLSASPTALPRVAAMRARASGADRAPAPDPGGTRKRRVTPRKPARAAKRATPPRAASKVAATATGAATKPVAAS